MRRVFNILLLCAAFGLSCSKDMPESSADSEKGIAVLTFSMPSTRAGEEYDPWSYCDIRFYKYDDASKVSKSLIRHYYEFDEIPESVWLMEGEYCVTVSLGDRESGIQATFDRPIYFGSTDFTIEAGRTTAVNVDCRIQNTIIKVVFDKSIVEKFDREGVDDVFGLRYKYRTTVAVSDDWSTGDVTGNKVPYLHYSDSDMSADAGGSVSRAGYFIIPNDSERVSYCFQGFSSDSTLAGYNPDNSGSDIYGESHAHRNKDLPLPAGVSTREGVMYTMTFKYSPDAPGYVSVDFTVGIADLDEKDDKVGIDPSPKPAVDGFDWPIAEIHPVEGQELKYTVFYPEAALSRVDISVDGYDGIFRSVDLSQCQDEYDGITVDIQQEGHVAELTFGAGFLNAFAGGQHVLTFNVTAANQKVADTRSTIRTQGLMSVEHKAWYGVAVADAVIFDASKAQAKIQYRETSSESWSDYTPESESENDVYTEKIGGMNAENRGKTFEFRLTVDGRQVGKSMEITTEETLPQIPNSGFETWSSVKFPIDSKAILGPYASEDDQWWDTGNHGSSTLNVNVTNYSTDAYEGTYSAYLNSQYVAFAGLVGKFAAGNIFVGQYAGTAGTNGLIAFGKPFPYTYRPKAIRFWYKGTVGIIDRTDGTPPSGVGKNQSDVAQFYCMVCKTGGPHIVDTRYTDTFINFDDSISYCTKLNGANSTNDSDDGLVIGCGTWERTRDGVTRTDGEGGHTMETYPAAIGEWTMMEMPINYNSEYDDELPTYILITASASKYGDYFTGSTDSVMYLDDVEIVY